MSEDMLAKKRARLEELKKQAAKKRGDRGKTGKDPKPLNTKIQGGKADDLNEYLDKVITTSAFEERKKQEFEKEEQPVKQVVNTSLSVAVDQCEHSIVPNKCEFLDQEIQCSKGKQTLDAKEESSEGEEEEIQKTNADGLRRPTISKTNVNGIPMVTDLSESIGLKEEDKEDKQQEEVEEVPKILSKDESKQVQQTPEFLHFFSKASRLIERGLYSEDDVIGSFERLEVEESDAGVSKDTKLIEKVSFMKDNPIKRAITNIDWSPQHNELFLCTYYVSENEWDTAETDGLINIFSVNMPSQPELTLTSVSQITSCIFHPLEPYLVLGGTVAGNVIIWDMREKRNYPVIKTATSDSMIKSIQTFTKDNQYNNIISVANNGTVCVWAKNMMKEPQKKIELSHNNNDVSVHCVDVPEGETNQFYIGSEDSNVYQAKIHTKSQSEQNLGEVYSGHMGTIFSLNYHPLITERKSEASNLMLTTGADWRLGLWQPRAKKDPLFMYEADCEIYDAQWSPVHPSVFATCNGNGQIDLWDISKETEEYRYRCEVDKRAINKIKWSNDGKRLISGNTNGTIKLWNVEKEFYQYRDEDFVKLEKQLAPSASFDR